MLSPRQKQIFEYIKEFLKKRGYSPSLKEIGKRFGVGKSTIHQHVEALKEKGYLDKTIYQPRTIEIMKDRKISDLVAIPLLGTITAGEPIETYQIPEKIEVPKNLLSKGGENFALKVSGNSMIDEGIFDGDTVIIKRQQTAENGENVVALINDSETTLKKIYKEKGGFRLQPANPDLKPIFTKELTIQGKVISVIRNFEELKEMEMVEIPQKIEKYPKLPVNQIICGDAVEVMQAMPSDSVDLVVTSPPYDELRGYKGYSFNFEGMTKGLFRVMKKGGVVVWVVGDQTIKGDETGTSFRQALYFKQVGFNLFDTMIYLKTPRGAVGNNKTYWQAFEYMFLLSKGAPKTINLIKDRENRDERSGDNGTKRLHDGTLLKLKRAGYSKYGRRTNVWEYLIGRGHSASDNIAYKHPAIFPEKLVQDHIISWSNPGDVVFDPMCGSGTTCKMAKLNKRDYIGIDIAPDYCKITEERLKQKPLL